MLVKYNTNLCIAGKFYKYKPPQVLINLKELVSYKICPQNKILLEISGRKILGKAFFS